MLNTRAGATGEGALCGREDGTDVPGWITDQATGWKAGEDYSGNLTTKFLLGSKFDEATRVRLAWSASVGQVSADSLRDPANSFSKTAGQLKSSSCSVGIDDGG
ncbi:MULTISPECIES: hypothetical protein [Burkholderia cepacia complex]|uniref:hypothetical protein n=1 Tax=Burkholderia cepacia complex TaxID=87882 RepID=UPI0013F16F55|nr:MULTISPECIES: hypothetical protein [Burkholderia cepacia complex]MBY4714283.1 hypothetical protein [Burkholderia cepacia]MBY4743410.1 hypothetical protein [Burkholderia cepacia]MBY4757459.1 hypothetical protein [Burkholderia cepacia]MBY4778378.1 hypothetical protein [Burkholderia cepacia]GLZ74546.1 hypothetical protein Bcon01_75910 [Burkholderia contaminans]